MAFSFHDVAWAQTTPSISIEGELLRPLKLSVKDVSAFSSMEVKAKDKDGREHVFRGVKLFDLLDSAGVTLGKQLRGKNLTKLILIKALDGYEIIFSLPEIDPEFTDQMVLLAYQVDGNPLSKEEGPFRLIVPGDKKHARWIRQVSLIKILSTHD